MPEVTTMTTEPGGVGVVVRADHLEVVPEQRRGLRQVEGLSLRQPLHDVHQDDVGDAGCDDPLGHGRADVPGPDDGDLAAGHAFACHVITSIPGPVGAGLYVVRRRRQRACPQYASGTKVWSVIGGRT